MKQGFDKFEMNKDWISILFSFINEKLIAMVDDQSDDDDKRSKTVKEWWPRQGKKSVEKIADYTNSGREKSVNNDVFIHDVIFVTFCQSFISV